ncbi:hypothetical protein BU15DRAFT_63839 [Melanogaster broomeanus]|nr:hypothetical protein BU15DRAFT_63839 [Melanogaster broomeanus]
MRSILFSLSFVSLFAAVACGSSGPGASLTRPFSPEPALLKGDLFSATAAERSTVTGTASNASVVAVDPANPATWPPDCIHRVLSGLNFTMMRLMGWTCRQRRGTTHLFTNHIHILRLCPQPTPKHAQRNLQSTPTLNACSEHTRRRRKDRRKSSVHIATLRANVRKIAESRKEKLGPQWTNWVGRAVHKLEDQGILKPVDSNGHVSMTEEGRKAVTAARRKVFGTSTPQEPNEDEEELLWRSVTEQFSPSTHISGARRRLSAPSTAGRKRRQSVRMAAGTEYEEEAEEEPSASMPAAAGTKRRRVTGAMVPVGTPQKPLSKMNKAEASQFTPLKGELRALQTKVLASQTTPRSTHQIPDPETQKLRNQLQDARKELAAFRRQSGLVFGEPDEALTDLEDEGMVAGEVDRASSPGDAVTTPTPARVRPSRPGMLTVTRTESGSLIPGVSGRPTPAPSEGEHLWDQGDMAHGMDEHGDVFTDGHADRDATGAGGQVITPDLTPPRQARGGEDQDALRGKIATLETSINAKTNEIEDLRTELAQRDEALVSLAEDETTIRMLQDALSAERARMAELQTALSASEMAITEQDACLSTTRSALAEKEAILAELQRVLEETVAEKDNTLEETIVSKDAIIATKFVSINELQAALATTQAEAISELELIRQQHAAQMKEMVETIRERDAELAERKDDVLQKDAMLEHARSRLDAANMDITRGREIAEELATRLATLQTQADETEARLRSSLETAQAEKEMSSEASLTLQLEKTALEAQTEEFRDRIVNLTRDLQTSRTQLTAAKTTILGLLSTVDEMSSLRDEEVRISMAAKEALYVVEVEARKLRDQVHDAELEIQQCRGELAKEHVALLAEQTSASMLRSRLTVTHTDLDTARSELETAKKEVVGAKEDLKAAEDEADALRNAKKADETIIKDLKGVYERLRTAQGEWMNELDSKIALAQSAPVPEPRRRAMHHDINVVAPAAS